MLADAHVEEILDEMNRAVPGVQPHVGCDLTRMMLLMVILVPRRLSFAARMLAALLLLLALVHFDRELLLLVHDVLQLSPQEALRGKISYFERVDTYAPCNN